MFDLNEFPDNDGPAAAGALLRLSEAKVESDGVAVTEEGLSSRGNSTKVICRLVEGDEEDVDMKDGAPLHSFLRLDSTSSMPYSAGWRGTVGLASLDGSGVDTDNEVTVAALDARSILDSKCVTGLDSAVSLVSPTETHANFGISPRPEKLGQRADLSRKHSDFSNFRTPAGEWDGFLSEKRGSERREGGLKFDSRQSLPYMSARKGKMARDDGSHEAVDTVIELERHARPASSLASSEGYPGAGPSLSMAINQVAAETLSISTRYKISGKGEGSVQEAETSLSLGEAARTGIMRADVRAPVSVESNLGLCMVAIPIGNTSDRDGDDLDDVVDGCRRGHDRDAGKRGTSRKATSGGDIPESFGGLPNENPFWQGQLCAEGFIETRVAAFCSENLQSTSKLRDLPKVMTVEKFVKIKEFLAALKKENVVEPLIRVRLLPDAAPINAHSFSSMVKCLNAKKKGKAKDRSTGPDLQLGWQSTSLALRNGVLASAGSESVFVATLKLKQAEDAGRMIPAKLYLVLGSSCETVAGMDRELGRKLLGELDRLDLSDENVLFGFLCLSEEKDQVDEFNRAADGVSKAALDIEAPVTKRSTPLLQGVSVSKIQVANHMEQVFVEDSKLICDDLKGVVGVVRPENEESSLTDAAHPTKSKDQKEHSVDSGPETRRLDKLRARKDNHGLRHYQIPSENELLKDRERRDRDLRGRDRERDFRSSNKDFHRYSHRSSERTDLFKHDRLKERELDRFREREHHRDFHRDPLERSKSTSERIKEQEKQKEKERQRDRDRERERERSIRKRGWSVETEKVKFDVSKILLECDRAGSSLKDESHERLIHQFRKDNRKRIKVGNTSEGEMEIVNLSAEGSACPNIDTPTAVEAKSELVNVTKEVEVVDVEDVSLMDLVTRSEGEGGLSEVGPMEIEGPIQPDTLVNGQEKITKELLDGQLKHFTTSSGNTNAPQVTSSTGTFEANTDVRVTGQLSNLETQVCDLPGDNNTQTDPENGSGDDRDVAREFKDPRDGEKSEPQENGGEGRLNDIHMAEVGPLGNEVECCTEGVAKSGSTSPDRRCKDEDVRATTLSVGPTSKSSSTSQDRRCKGEDVGATKLSVGPTSGRKMESQIVDDVAEHKSGAITVNVCHAAEGQKSDNNRASQELEGLPVRYSKGSDDTPAHKTGMSVTEELQGRLTAASLVMEIGTSGPFLSLSADGKEVSCEILLEGCDKETRVWLVSKQNASYLSDEFGVRIARLEEIVNAKFDTSVKNQPGSINVRVFLVTEKPTDANEAKWFMSQAADNLRSIAARGVFAKCLWYQGPVHRYSGDQAPSIQVVVKRIKGDDGKNLERIQEETGVMIGIVLDANSKKGIVNSSRVIGLRLKCTRKKGFLEATKQLEDLLLQVAQQFSKGTRAGGAMGSQDTALFQLKVEFSNTSPSSGILTPMQKDVFAAYSPVSPVAATSPPGSFKCKVDDPSMEAVHACMASAIVPIPPLPASTGSVLNGNPPATREFAAKSQQSQDEEHDDVHGAPDPESKCSRPLYVSNIPARASASMLRELFDDVLREKLDLPVAVLNMVLDVKFAPDNSCAFVEFQSEELLMEVLKIYADDRAAFCGLKLELGSSSSLQKLDRKVLATRNETSSKGLEFVGGIVEPLAFPRPRTGRKVLKSDDHPGRLANAVRSSTESDIELLNQDLSYGGREIGSRHLRIIEKPKPLFLTELMRNASARLIHNLFEDIIKKYSGPSLGIFKRRGTVLDVRYIPSRGCAFVDLATSDLVEFMLDLHSRRPEVFYNMKMEIGRRPVPLGHGEEEPVMKRSSYYGRNGLVEESHSYGSGRKVRKYHPSTTPPPRRSEMAALDQDFVDEYEEEEEEEERQPNTSRKRRSDPERTVYADRLPENASEGMISRIFERVLRENMTPEQRELWGEQPITEVRYVPTKFCAFIVFVAEEITRLVLQLYNQDEEIFENMRLKPHFHSRMEDLYRDDVHDREDATPHVMSRDLGIDRRSRRGMEEYQNSKHSAADVNDLVPRVRTSSAHRAVAATAFKEVDRRRSVYVDRIPERLPESSMRELFERALRQNRHAYSSHVVSQVTFFRDKFDPDKLCSFVELENEELVQELLEAFVEDEDAFSGMRVRPAVKFGN